MWRMPTFGSLREVVLLRAGTPGNHFEFTRLSRKHSEFWDKINKVEFDRGYTPGVYEQPDSPALCGMELLTEDEFQEWLVEFESLSKNIRQ
jgi:hypothetical protein